MWGHHDFTLGTSEETRPCVGTDPELWFGSDNDVAPQLRETRSERAAREDVAKQVCADCPFTAQCLDQELSFGIADQWGVRGGKTARERRTLLRQRRRFTHLRPVTSDAAVA